MYFYFHHLLLEITSASQGFLFFLPEEKMYIKTYVTPFHEMSDSMSGCRSVLCLFDFLKVYNTFWKLY